MDDLEFKYCAPSFYLEKIIDAVMATRSNDTHALGIAVFSYFSGSDYKMGDAANLQSKHFQAIFELDDLFFYFRRSSNILLSWIESLFYYCRSMSAISEIVITVWPLAAKAVEIWRDMNEVEGILASSQLASWDYHYGRTNHPAYLNSIKAWKMTSQRAITLRDLLCSTSINQDQPDFKKYVRRSYLSKEMLGHENKAISILTYYCNIESSTEVLDELIDLLRSQEMNSLVKSGNCDFLKAIIAHLYGENNYRSLYKLLAAMKGDFPLEGVCEVSHGFLLANGNNITALTTSSKIEFATECSFENYKNLIRLRNRSLNLYVSLLGEPSDDATYLDTGRGGTPPVEDDMSAYKNSVIRHFRLDDDLYDEVSSLTLAPSHDFPIQTARFSLERSAPLISVSLEMVADDAENKTFVFMLSSHTHTVEIERQFILSMFGDEAEIYIDPSVEEFIGIMQGERHNVVYISAHGEYNHWSDGTDDRIFFSKTASIPGSIVRSCAPKSTHNRNVILNICNGATVEISCNPYSRGIAAAIARGNQTVVSHLWPVNPIYAACFGMLILHLVQRNTLLEATRVAYKILNQDNEEIIKEALRLTPDFEIFARFIETKNFEMRVFKNIGSLAVYS